MDHGPSWLGAIYFASGSTAEDEVMLRMYSRKLRDIERESTFDVVYSRLGRRRNWRLQYDVVPPFQDPRHVHLKSIWTFDLDDDVLRLDKKDLNLQVPLNLVRFRSITIADFEPYQPPLARSKHSLQSVFVFPRSWTNMTRNGVDRSQLLRYKALVPILLADFVYQWRHVFGGRYNNATFRRLAFAIIKIATLDFRVEEVTQPRPPIATHFIWINDLPDWEPFSGDIVRVGGVSIVISQHIPHAVSLILKDFAKRNRQSAQDPQDPQNQLPGNSLTYLVFSVKEVILFRMSRQGERHSRTLRLFDGVEPPSDEAIDLLLEATQTSVPTTRLHHLPMELQDAAIRNVAAGPIESARVGCILNAGSVFTWRRNNRSIRRQEVRAFRSPQSPVESQIFFGDSFSGLAYK
ncbi:hypothetical protein SAPIO_CDS1106 [Scedosporium apiospermum]|uniref:Uncharacterized protein n=1 Tax=Pseudallescheria apiosperma TaxID=563466 RepID=A0A084GFV8_PSEDA|nr:uncharacterized protein SAPIO_CDS1106 [Scedosporium apiospermum]KEZ46220.1 hypothetical protein SAPIO_CDS1106 [Scedosporium apiospermum]